MHRLRTALVSVWLAAMSSATVFAVPPGPPNSALPWALDPPAGPALARAAGIAQLGRAMFSDPKLSASRAISCATCHDPANHFAPVNALAVQRGGVRLDQPGTRAVPGLTYATAIPFFTEHYYESDEDANGSIDQGPTGGRTWDGRVNRARDQAVIPLLAANEMGNRSEAELARRLASAPYARQMKALYGDKIFADPRQALAAAGAALEAYQQTRTEFAAYTSKYDAFLRGQTALSAQELRGLEAFNNPGKGNCAHCHKSRPTASGVLPLLTDFGYVALGVPRNREIPANADPKYFDLGACGPQRRDLATRPEFCGLFRAPSLRNVATRRSFYHNGVFHSLQEAVSFYATRDTDPKRWYPAGPDGQVLKFDDLPQRYQGNINNEPPFGRHAGDKPALSDQDVSDIVAFLATLTDGFSPPAAVKER